MIFHYQVRTETHVLLTEVVQLEHLDAARVEASRRVGRLLLEHAGQIWVDEEWQMDVTDEAGLILFVIHISAMLTAATTPAKTPGI